MTLQCLSYLHIFATTCKHTYVCTSMSVGLCWCAYIQTVTTNEQAYECTRTKLASATLILHLFQQSDYLSDWVDWLTAWLTDWATIYVLLQWYARILLHVCCPTARLNRPLPTSPATTTTSGHQSHRLPSHSALSAALCKFLAISLRNIFCFRFHFAWLHCCSCYDLLLLLLCAATAAADFVFYIPFKCGCRAFAAQAMACMYLFVCICVWL